MYYFFSCQYPPGKDNKKTYFVNVFHLDRASYYIVGKKGIPKCLQV